MHSPSPGPPPLDVKHCHSRQTRLRGLLHDLKLDAVLLTDRHYVYWATAYWHASALTPTAVLVPRDGPIVLVSYGDQFTDTVVDEVITYRPHKLCTLLENLDTAVTRPLQDRLQRMRRIGTTTAARPWLAPSATWVDMTTDFQILRRRKDPDEVDAIRYAIIAAEAAYAKARDVLRPGVSEVEMFASMQAAATLTANGPLSGWGNDFQIGTPGGPPRDRKALAGELAILDIGVGVRGYRCDLCRTFSVSGSVSELQHEAHRRVALALDDVERLIRPGLSCVTLYETMREHLDGWNKYSFFHHLGHGIGLDGHEVPRLNPHWNDTFHVGDVVAVEPGLYGEPLRGGVRLEQDYLVTESGVERLSNFPLDL